MATCEFIQLSHGDGVAAITLNRPPLNVLHMPMMAEINAALEGLVADDGVAAIVFRAQGKAFCAGVDVADHTPDKTPEMIRLFHGIFRKLAATDALTIAAVQGAALGGGCEVACFCDIVLASDRAKFGQPEVQVGVFPPVAACVLPLRVGLGKAIELNALGGVVDAAEAHRIGLVDRIFAADQFDGGVEQFLSQIRGLSRPVVRLAKKATVLAARRQIVAHLDEAERLYLDDLMKLADAHEGITAFLGKRPPVWKHR
ncbi:MAG: enoyl-CoA hydratase/isomerase family protein [Planctomycetes bacterium]|nr:enoyl-CoA hydratase/isomerase family protein [Planctomycetota bacterium]